MLALAMNLPLIILNVLHMAQGTTVLVIHPLIKTNHLVLLMERAVTNQPLKIPLAREMRHHPVWNQLLQRLLFAMAIAAPLAKVPPFPAIPFAMQIRKALAGILKIMTAQLKPPPFTKAKPAAKAHIARQARQSVIAVLTQTPANTRFLAKINIPRKFVGDVYLYLIIKTL